MPLNDATAAFIGASVTLFLVIVFMILMVILVRQCLAFLAKRNSLRAQTEQQLQARRQRRGSVTEPVPATFDWHHSIRIAGTPPPSYIEAKDLPAYNEAVSPTKKKRGRKAERGRQQQQQQQTSSEPEVIVTRNRSASAMENEERQREADNTTTRHHRRHTSPHNIRSPQHGGEAPSRTDGGGGGSLSLTVEQANERNSHLIITSELASSAPPQHTVVELESTGEESRQSFQVISTEEEATDRVANGQTVQSAQ